MTILDIFLNENGEKFFKNTLLSYKLNKSIVWCSLCWLYSSVLRMLNKEINIDSAYLFRV